MPEKESCSIGTNTNGRPSPRISVGIIISTSFFKMLASDEQRAWYGPDHVSLAVDRCAVGTLLISDELFRAGDPEVRKRYVSLVEDVREKRGEVLMFSSMHESGQRK